MTKIKVFHESPISISDVVSNYTDGEYILPHLMAKPEYHDYMMAAKKSGRYILLDNSVHELGTPLGDEELLDWINKIQPDEFFVPDFWEDTNESIESARKWSKYQSKFPKTTFIAVVQAQSDFQAIGCFRWYKSLNYKKIAFSYGASWYNSVCPHPNKDLSKALGRVKFISDLISQDLLKQTDRIHLLGTSYPGEFAWYKDIKCVESIDTSSPIIATFEKTEYKHNGLNSKPTTKIDQIIDLDESHFDKYILNHNLSMFKKINNI